MWKTDVKETYGIGVSNIKYLTVFCHGAYPKRTIEAPVDAGQIFP